MPDEPVDLGDLTDLRDGQMRTFADIGAHGLVVCRVNGVLHAVEDNCSHRDARLSEGRLRGNLLTCPVHGAQFDVRDGTPKSSPATVPVACFAVHEAGGRATVQVPDGA